MINSDSFVTIQGWMRTELDLSGTELMVYAVIYGFSQDGESHFKGSRQYLADWCGTTVRSIHNALTSLVEKNLILKYEREVNGVKVCEYCTNFTTGEKISPPHEKFSPNNIADNIGDSISPKGDICETAGNDNDDVVADDGFEGHSYDSFIGSNKKKSKPAYKRKESLFNKCSELNYQFTDNVITANMLDEYLKVRLQMKDKPIYGVNQWSGILDKLRELAGDDERQRQRIIKQSIERGWGSFFEISSGSKRDIKTVSCEGNIVKSNKKEGNVSGEKF